VNGWYNPDNLLDVLDHLILALTGIGVVAIPSFLSARNHKSLRDIKDQVVNGHASPMRADLDKALAAIEALSRDIHDLRHDLLAERDSRRAQVDDLRSDVDRMRQR
jgi:hypothetical protein